MNMIMDNVPHLEEKLNVFVGVKGSKEYEFLHENFTQNLEALDKIDIKRRDTFRKQRKEYINKINRCLGILESKMENKAEEITSELKNEEKNGSPETTVLIEGE